MDTSEAAPVTAEIAPNILTADTLPPGDYAIVELFGHTTLVGRIAEVERFGTRMLAIEPLFNDRLLGPIYHGGAAIYRLSPCEARVAWERQPRDTWQLPPAIRAVVPLAALPAAAPQPPFADESDDDPLTADDDEEF